MSTSNHQISLAKAVGMTKKYRQSRPDNLPICETFESDVISALLAQPGCSFFRIYYGMDENNEIHAILVGANESNEDILPADSADTESVDTTGGTGLLEDGYRCPNDCPKASPLNS